MSVRKMADGSVASTTDRAGSWQEESSSNTFCFSPISSSRSPSGVFATANQQMRP